MKYELVVGLEVHCQLNTNSKAFCGCSTRFGNPANTNVCPVCLALPGALPVLNRRVVEDAVKLGLATGCSIAPSSILARKNYFYPDLPKGYQISQFEEPICTEGMLRIDVGDGCRDIRLIRIHIEEDAGKSIHDIGDDTYIDVNRCGVPLLEIVSYPDIRTSREASAYLQKMRQIVKYLGISDGNMEEGSLRCDANVSVRLFGAEEYGTRTEIKNMNSFKNVEKAIEYEMQRHIDIIDGGGTIVQETRLWDADKGETRSMRGKEFAHDYRYFPDPDLVPVLVDQEMLERIRLELPEFPEDRERRFVSEYGIPPYDAGVLTVEREIADYFERTLTVCGDAKAASNWVMGEVMRTLKEKYLDIKEFAISPERLGGLIGLIGKGAISNTIAKQVFELMQTGEASAEEIVDREGLAQVSDTGAIERTVDEILEANPKQLADYREGKTKLFGFFVGQCMARMKGKANPQVVNDVLKSRLDG
ncbi:MAG: Asp-tRNA(Asn)/Glu-tRNA(Gln) amidotransferase subunit GatB [Chlorobium limicola]|uniref:Aspartyl/glutamyl-tRNA(Asn/Gln) amidotransferase subunit B n=1 Tax=Chlorobium limicola (strain DSM 245 / NBRC 103803 / 6330) TaxID=290315 RepID=GATB_CHLL2|nr:Asp-tRNA(Asn)/Glu-tRNA(Gln) amidotransferase subunit GatB [Chlorobium limicola]B3EHE8.1 RecName: Full=Aspartyl/glutamyl-tRNA(Asn/Gln) amidotransferase subunit B; Short=Asp/Glu-ADT subunit B [Chlorobium limicola DSM 245]ACD91310.1 glutamyl-tRNA(Gln) amidotransferase, B subunit [Chlorobium limicola DSM 245]NTV07832.1 Asp-tRNA(Asn)/Glu-tRNA(Gln) amidotransferase subunit GatB [Chlorobium limicola]NTV20257.1 Asp-tRNA(Asn)/Glu-tRNA(Gln) amidotransferase subunit GatB [Chlorobium limicola]